MAQGLGEGYTIAFIPLWSQSHGYGKAQLVSSYHGHNVMGYDTMGTFFPSSTCLGFKPLSARTCSLPGRHSSYVYRGYGSVGA